MSVRPSVRPSHTNWIFEKSDISTKVEQKSTKNMKLYYLKDNYETSTRAELCETWFSLTQLYSSFHDPKLIKKQFIVPVTNHIDSSMIDSLLSSLSCFGYHSVVVAVVAVVIVVLLVLDRRTQTHPFIDMRERILECQRIRYISYTGSTKPVRVETMGSQIAIWCGWLSDFMVGSNSFRFPKKHWVFLIFVHPFWR